MMFLKNELRTGRIAVKARRTGGNEGFLMFLRADSATAENSLDEPLRIQPQRQALPGCSRNFTVELAPRSVNVLCIPAEPVRH